MSEFTEKKELVGTIYTMAGSFDMLELNPAERFSMPTYLRNGAMVFYVVDENGYAVPLVVKGDFVIVTNPVPLEMDVKFVIEEREEIPLTRYSLVSDSVE